MIHYKAFAAAACTRTMQNAGKGPEFRRFSLERILLGGLDRISQERRAMTEYFELLGEIAIEYFLILSMIAVDETLSRRKIPGKM